MYISVEDAKAYPTLNLTNLTDEQIEVLILRAGAIVDAYLGQSLELQEYTEKVPATPNDRGGFHVQLSKRFIQTIDNLQINYGYGISSLVYEYADHFFSTEEGYLETSFGALAMGGCTAGNLINENSNSQWYQAEVTYTAGFAEDDMPADFLTAFYGVLEANMPVLSPAFSSGGNYVAEVQAQSTIISEYQTLNERIKYSEDKVRSKVVSDVLSDWITRILDKYKLNRDAQGLGRWM